MAKQMNEFMVSSGLKTDTKAILGKLKKKVQEAEDMLDDVVEPATPSDIEDFGSENDVQIDGEVPAEGEGTTDINTIIADLETVLSSLQSLPGADSGMPPEEVDMPDAGGVDDIGGEDDFPVESKRTNRMSKLDEHIASIKNKAKKIPGLVERVTGDIIKEANNLDVRTSAKLSGSGDSGNVTFDGAGNLNTRDVSNNGKVTQTPGSAGAQHDLDTPADKGPTFDGIPDVPKAGSSRFLQSNGGDLGSVAESRDNSTVRNPKAVAPGSYVVVYKRGTLEKVDSGIVHKVTSNSLTLEGDETYDMGSHDYRTLAT